MTARIDEDTLHAYVDGQLDAAQARAVEARLAGDPAARSMVDAYRWQSLQLSALFDEAAGQMATGMPSVAELAAQTDRLEAAADDPAIQELSAQGSAARASGGGAALGPWGWIMGAVLAIGVGVLVGRLTVMDLPAPTTPQLQPTATAEATMEPTAEPTADGIPVAQAPTPAPLGWRATVALYHQLYTQQTFASLDVSAEQAQQALSRVAGLVQVDGSDALLDLPDLRLAQAQVLDFRGRPLAHIAYLDGNDQPVALCIIPRPAGSTDPAFDPLYEEREGLPVVHWSDGQHDFMVIGHSDEAAMRAIAGQVIARL